MVGEFEGAEEVAERERLRGGAGIDGGRGRVGARGVMAGEVAWGRGK